MKIFFFLKKRIKNFYCIYVKYLNLRHKKLQSASVDFYIMYYYLKIYKLIDKVLMKENLRYAYNI
jgi:hypothetical protein